MKNKYFYRIYKLKIKPWIKYWLIKTGEIKGVLSEILTGTSFYLEDSIRRKFKLFKIYGRTTQESTTGKNLFNGENPTGLSSTTSSFDNNILTVSSTATNTVPSAIWRYDDITQDDIFRINAILLDSNCQIIMQTYNGTSWTSVAASKLLYTDGKTTSSYSYTVGSGITAIRFLIYSNPSIPSGAVSAKYKNVIITKNNSDMTYEPYTGGEPAPSPSYPFPIKNTGDNGSVNVKVQNKNLFTEENMTVGKWLSSAGAASTNANSIITDYIRVLSNRSYVSSGNNGNRARNYFTINQYDINKNRIKGNEYSCPVNTNFVKTHTLEDNCVYIKISILNFADISDYQLEQGSTATSYVPHAEQNISFPLAQGQFLAEDEELKDDGKENLWGIDTVTGTTKTFTDAKTNGRYYCNQKVAGTLNGQTITFDTSVTNAIVQYELATPAITPYTEEQQTAYNQIKELYTYLNQTIISSTDTTPPYLEIQYWKEA